MKLTDQAISTFAALWEREFDEVLTFDDARVKARAFLELCWLLVQPLPGEPDYQGPPIPEPLI